MPGAPAELSAFVDLHAMILADPALTDGVRELIRERRCNAEWALVQQMQLVVDQFDEIEDAYLRERKQDIVQVVERVLKVLQGKQRKLAKRKASAASMADDDLIVVAHDLSPGRHHPVQDPEDRRLRHRSGRRHLAYRHRRTQPGHPGGGRPAACPSADPRRRPADRRRHARRADRRARRGRAGGIPAAARAELELERAKLKRLVTGRPRTLDGEDVELYANIELPQDAGQVKEVDADGVGLFRTEFLFMNRDELPDEDEQFEAYRSVVKALAGKPVTIRTLDIGADKEARALRNRAGNRAEPNPALGLRAIRFCLAEPQLFLTQLRAILRASHYGKVRLLIPMLAHAHEIEQTLSLIELAKAPAARVAAKVRRDRGRRHDRNSRRGAGARALPAPPGFPVDRHQRSDPVHAGDRSHRRRRGPSLRSPASGRAQADFTDHPERAAGGHAGGGMRRNGRRPEA